MFDLKSFIKFALRYKWLLITVPVVAITLTYFLVQNLPKQYFSEVQISTGLLDPSKKIISEETIDFFAVSQQFSNIIEKLKMKKVVNLLSYNLMLHDLENPSATFRNYSSKIDSLKQEDRIKIIELLQNKRSRREILTPADNNGNYKLFDIIKSMGYDEDELRKTIEISHADNSDLINITFVSENPVLSAYVVNTLAKEFIQYYSSELNTNQNSSIAVLDSLLKVKAEVMNEKNQALSTFKRTKGVLNLESQSATVYSQISDYEAQRADALKLIQANQGAIAILDSKLRGNDPNLKGSSSAENREIVNLKRQLETANSRLIDGNFNIRDQKKVDSLTRIINIKSAKNSDDNLLDPRTSKQSLVQQKLALEIALQQAKSSIRSLDKQLATLRSRYQGMVPFDSDIQNYEREAELATKDYMTALDRYNQSRTQQKMGLHLNIEQVGFPGIAEPSKRGLYIAGSGFSSFMCCLTILFAFFILDKTITTAKQLQYATNSKVIGTISFIEGPQKNMRDIWNEKDSNLDYNLFKDLLRSLRFEISNNMAEHESKILGVTSLVSGEGKTFLANSLAYAFAMTGKKILLIADEHVGLTTDAKAITESQNFQTFLVKKEILVDDLITIMNKSSEKSSLLEIQNIKSLRAGFEILRREFDIIIVDVNSLQEMNLAKEWLLFTETNICIFESGRRLTEFDKKHLDYITSQPGFVGWVLNKFKFPKVA